VTVGKNGKIWFKAEKEEHSTLIYNLLKKAQSLNEEE
jgi:exosome complex RNA-binding protein Rrp4